MRSRIVVQCIWQSIRENATGNFSSDFNEFRQKYATCDIRNWKLNRENIQVFKVSASACHRCVLINWVGRISSCIAVGTYKSRFGRRKQWRSYEHFWILVRLTDIGCSNRSSTARNERFRETLHVSKFYLVLLYSIWSVTIRGVASMGQGGAIAPPHLKLLPPPS